MADLVLYQPQGPAALITLNDPRRRNPLSLQMIADILKALDRAEADPDIRAVILTGEDPAFCAGMDLEELRNVIQKRKIDESGAVYEGALRAEKLMDRIYMFPKPTIAAVNGPAIAGGAGLVSVCDMVVAAEEAAFGYPEMKRGVQASTVILHLMRIVGERVARYLLLTGVRISAEEALRIGLINAIAPKFALLDTAMTWASEIAANGPRAETTTKNLLRRFSAQALSMGLIEYTAAPHLTDECKEGVNAFFEGRRPSWTGRD